MCVCVRLLVSFFSFSLSAFRVLCRFLNKKTRRSHPSRFALRLLSLSLSFFLPFFHPKKKFPPEPKKTQKSSKSHSFEAERKQKRKDLTNNKKISARVEETHTSHREEKNAERKQTTVQVRIVLREYYERACICRERERAFVRGFFARAVAEF